MLMPLVPKQFGPKLDLAGGGKSAIRTYTTQGSFVQSKILPAKKLARFSTHGSEGIQAGLYHSFKQHVIPPGEKERGRNQMASWKLWWANLARTMT